MPNGIGCTCGAYSESECGCGVDWTSQREIDLENEINILKKKLFLQRKFNGIDHLEILRSHNEWRRGCDDMEMFDPKTIGIAIDSVIAELEMRRRGECICAKCGLRQDSEQAKVEF